jgi:hypothetical protein
MNSVPPMLASYSPLEAQTRYYGADWAGAGLVFSTPAAQISEDIDPASFPLYWRWLIAIDLSHGGQSAAAHPFAAVMCCYDPDKCVLHVVDTIRMYGSLPEQHVGAILAWPVSDAPVAWPHDGNAGSGTGETYAARYRWLGLNMLPGHATFDSAGGYAFDPGIDLMDNMMATGKLQVARHLRDWFEEYHMYSRDDKGAVVKVRDDLLSATRLACMCTRHARPLDPERPQHNGMRARRHRANAMADGIEFDPWNPGE